MKAIMISDKPKWCALMMNGIKTIEFRKSKALATAIQKLIDENGYADIYVYCCYGPTLSKGTRENKLTKDGHLIINKPIVLNGKVIFKFRCYKVEAIDVRLGHPKIYVGACVDDMWCLDNCYHDKNYLVNAIHISDLEIFDKPKELSEFYTTKLDEDLIKRFDNSIQLENGTWVKPITKTPQNFCYVENNTFISKERR